MSEKMQDLSTSHSYWLILGCLCQFGYRWTLDSMRRLDGTGELAALYTRLQPPFLSGIALGLCRPSRSIQPSLHPLRPELPTQGLYQTVVGGKTHRSKEPRQGRNPCSAQLRAAQVVESLRFRQSNPNGLATRTRSSSGFLQQNFSSVMKKSHGTIRLPHVPAAHPVPHFTVDPPA